MDELLEGTGMTARPARHSEGRRRIGILAAAVLAAMGLRLANANLAQSQAATLKVWRVDRDPGLNATAKVWSGIPPIDVPLTAQQGVYPFGGGSIPTVSARAVHYRDRLYLHVEWADETEDITTDQVEYFADAVAVEFPSKAASSVPSVCMGQADQGVNIWQWRADSQPDLAAAGLLHNPYVDYYPSQDNLWYPAREAGNLYDRKGTNPVQNLVARSFGTIGPAREQPVTGRGAYEDGHWLVVLTRPYPSIGEDQPTFASNQITDIAFAAWNGSHGDRNGKKQVSQFVRLAFSQDSASSGWEWLWVVVFAVFGIPILAMGFWRPDQPFPLSSWRARQKMRS